jgi:hypothetical protein
MPSQQTPAVGDWVGVPWYVDIVEGVIVRIVDTGSDRCAVVSVQLPGDGDKPPSQTVTVPVSHLCPLDESRARHLRSAFREAEREQG